MEPIQLDKKSLLPMYYQIAQKIKAYIAANNLKEGDVIPPERELCEAFGVSRMTVRQAVDTLTSEGLLERQRGRGTFITAPKISQPLSYLSGFTADSIARGMQPSSKVVSLQTAPAGHKVAEKLGLAEGAPVVRLVRVRCANGEPHAYESSHLPHEYAKPLLDMDFTHRSLYQSLSEDCGLHLARAREAIEAKSGSSEICRFLKIPALSIVFFIERTTYDDKGRAVEYAESSYRTDKFRFEVEMALH